MQEPNRRSTKTILNISGIIYADRVLQDEASQRLSTEIFLFSLLSSIYRCTLALSLSPIFTRLSLSLLMSDSRGAVNPLSFCLKSSILSIAIKLSDGFRGLAMLFAANLRFSRYRLDSDAFLGLFFSANFISKALFVTLIILCLLEQSYQSSAVLLGLDVLSFSRSFSYREGLQCKDGDYCLENPANMVDSFLLIICSNSSLEFYSVLTTYCVEAIRGSLPFLVLLGTLQKLMVVNIYALSLLTNQILQPYAKSSGDSHARNPPSIAPLINNMIENPNSKPKILILTNQAAHTTAKTIQTSLNLTKQAEVKIVLQSDQQLNRSEGMLRANQHQPNVAAQLKQLKEGGNRYPDCRQLEQWLKQSRTFEPNQDQGIQVQNRRVLWKSLAGLKLSEIVDTLIQIMEVSIASQETDNRLEEIFGVLAQLRKEVCKASRKVADLPAR